MARRYGIKWRSGKVTVLDPDRRKITVEENQIIDYDYLAIATGASLAFNEIQYAMILPSFRGVQFLREVPGLTNEKGFIPMLPSQRHPDFPSIYALGVSVDLKQLDKILVPIGLPKSGEMTEAIGVAVAHNIAVELGAIRSPLTKPTLEALYFAEYKYLGIDHLGFSQLSC